MTLEKLPQTTKRETLQSILEDRLGSDQVYFQAPEDLKLTYPAIIYKREKIVTKKADNCNYHKSTRYTVTLITLDPDSEIVYSLLDLEYCSHDRHYVSNGLHHDIFTIYM